MALIINNSSLMIGDELLNATGNRLFTEDEQHGLVGQCRRLALAGSGKGSLVWIGEPGWSADRVIR